MAKAEKPKVKRPFDVAWCVKCRDFRKMKDHKEVKMKGKGGPRRALKGNCPECDCGMYKILGKA